MVSNKAAPEAQNKPEFNIEEAYEAAIERTAKKEPQPKPESINMRKKIAHEMGVSENYVHQLQTVGDAAKAGVPEAQDALKRAYKGEITLNRAYEITKQATTPPRSKCFPFNGTFPPRGVFLIELRKIAVFALCNPRVEARRTAFFPG